MGLKTKIAVGVLAITLATTNINYVVQRTEAAKAMEEVSRLTTGYRKYAVEERHSLSDHKIYAENVIGSMNNAIEETTDLQRVKWWAIPVGALEAIITDSRPQTSIIKGYRITRPDFRDEIVILTDPYLKDDLYNIQGKWENHLVGILREEAR